MTRFDSTPLRRALVAFTLIGTLCAIGIGTSDASAQTPTQLAISDVNGGVNPIAGTAFSVVVQAQDSSDAPAPVAADTGVSLSQFTGTGTLGGTLTGTITAGTSEVTISGMTYSKAESGVLLRADRTSGDLLFGGTSAPFTVTAGTFAGYALTANSGVIVGAADRITITPVDAVGNATTGGSATITLTGRDAADTADNANVEVDADKNGTFGDAVVDTSGGPATFDIRNAVLESFRVRASDGINSAVSGVITTYPLATTGQVVISELALRGFNGADDEYINFYNRTDADILVGTTDGSAGWPLVAADGVTRFTIPNGTLLPARGSYLATNSNAFSLTDYPAGAGGATVGFGDIQYDVDIPSRLAGAGVALFRSELTTDLANRLDAVGYTTADPLYREGAGFPTGGLEQTGNIPHAFVRDLLTGVPKDTDDNAADFKSLDPAGTLPVLGPRLGVPSPHSLASPVRRSQFAVTAIPAVPTTVRDNRPYTWNIPNGGGTFFLIGVLSVPKRFTNNTGQDVTRLRVRIVDLTTFPPGLGVSDLRVIDATGTVTNSAGATVVSGLEPMLVEVPLMQPSGGGLNTTLTLDVSSLPGGVLANNATVDVHILLGVRRTGSFRFYIMMEALP